MTATISMATLCFDILSNNLKNEPTDNLINEFLQHEPQANIKFPIFVSWRSIPSRENRGCIGTFSASPLFSIIPHYALISSLQDTRFHPITLAELPQIEVTISLLTNFTKTRTLYDWEIGKHGLIFEVEYENSYISSTYLPDVILESQWDQNETLLELLLKAGHPDPSLEAIESLSERIMLTRYESSRYALTYEEYLKNKFN